MRGSRRYGAAAVAALALALAGCGEEERFDARGFVERINAEGVAMELGRPLISGEEGQEVYAVKLEEVADLPGSHGHSGGSLSVFDDGDAATDELESCRASADLLCYRAANVVVVLEGGGIETQQLAVAMQRLED